MRKEVVILTASICSSDASVSALERLSLLSDQVASISDGVDSLTHGMGAVSLNIEELRNVSALTSSGVESLLLYQAGKCFNRLAIADGR